VRTTETDKVALVDSPPTDPLKAAISKAVLKDDMAGLTRHVKARDGT
jgi:hypothetical protein